MRLLVVGFLLTFRLSYGKLGDEIPALEIKPPQGVCNGLQRMEVLPGRGWDNLRHKDMGQVLEITYDRCRLTDDRQYLLPDYVHASAIKETDLQLTSELIDHWSNYTSIDAKSFQANAGANFGLWSISGSFSAGYQDMKQHQVDDKSMTTRIQLRTTMYNVQASPASKIHPDLKRQFLEALDALMTENLEKTDLLLELIVRDYGTHYITQAEAGAVLYEEDFISSTFVKNNEDSKSQITAAAGASFLGKFNFGIKYQQSTESKITDEYKKNTTSSNVRSLGGSTFTPNLTVADWVDNLSNNLVMTDRFGDPLSYLIVPQKFENISLYWLGRLRQEVDDAIQRYYSYNTHIGCMNVDSPNFDYSANKEDNSCRSRSNNYTFGGTFQTCKSSQTGAGDLCVDLSQKNYLTGDFTCPPNYNQVLLHQGQASKSSTTHECHESCHRSWIFWKKCSQECSTNNLKSSANYETFWCVDVGVVSPNTGYMFAGLYTDIMNNPFTSAKSCPPSYTTMKIGNNVYICVSDDYELGYRYSVPFAGFFSCQQGNPLVTKNRPPLSQSCPDGFSQHLATIIDDCEIHYCVETNAFGKYGLTAVIRPPFTDMSKLYMTTSAVLKTYPAEPYIVQSLSGGSVAGIVVSCVVVLISIGAFIFYRRRRAVTRANPAAESEDREPLLDDHAAHSAENTYGTINSSEDEVVVAVQ